MALSFEFPLPHLFQKGLNTIIRAPAVDGGALVAPSSGTCTIYDAAGVQMSTGPVVVTGGVATYTVPSASLAAASLGDGWRAEWSLVVAGETYNIRNSAAYVRFGAPSVISTRTIMLRVSTLDGSVAGGITGRTDYSGEIESARIEIQSRLLEVDRRPWLIMSPSSLLRVSLYLTLSIVYESLATTDNNLLEYATNFRELYEAAWRSLSFTYDEDDDGESDGVKATSGPVWLMSR